MGSPPKIGKEELDLPRLSLLSQRDTHAELTAVAGFADDVHLTVEQLDPTGDIGDPHAFAVTGGIEANAVIGDRQQHILPFDVQPDQYFGGPGMLDNIIQLVLYDAEHRELAPV